MVAVDQVLVSDEVFDSYFQCELSACLGACCWEGDYGAPLDEEELKILAEIRTRLRPFLSEESNRLLEQKGTHDLYGKERFAGTLLHNDGSCVYLTRDENGIASCGIERAYEAGVIAFRKPVSCHLYPIRVQNLHVGYAINYDQWHICQAACSRGASAKVKLIEFAKQGLVRRFGQNWYDKLVRIQRELFETPGEEIT